MDFGRLYKGKTGPERSFASERPKRHWLSKLSLLVTIMTVAFVLGLFAGTQWQKHKFAQNVEEQAISQEFKSANITPVKTPSDSQSGEVHAGDETEKQKQAKNQGKREAEKNSEQKKYSDLKKKLSEDNESYLILARMYQSKEEAHQKGLKLKKRELPVFLAKSGDKMKVYVGPVKGKNQAYSMLAKVKKLPEFSGAIMYKK